jgi:tetratricopeptide (TPR) repeat protein
MAMAHWQLGHKDEARTWFELADEFEDDELSRIHEEAAALLGLTPMRLRAEMLKQGRAAAESMQWRRAFLSYAKAGMAPSVGRGNVAFEKACYALLLNDHAAYRRMVTAVLKPPAGIPAARPFLVGRLCTLAPVPADDLSRAEKIAATELRANQGFYALTASAGLRYRAGRYQQSLELLHKCLKDYPTWDGRVLNWIWLSMAYHRLGKESEARQWLDKATQWFATNATHMPQATQGGISWHLHDWLEAQVLCREGEALILHHKQHKDHNALPSAGTP